MKPFFFTFGSNHCDNNGCSLGHKFVKIEADDELSAREIMWKARGEKWAFSYTEEEFAPQPSLYGLTEVDIYDVAFMRF